MKFGYNYSGINATQFYETEKDWIIDTYENMTIFTGERVKTYIKIIDDNSNPISDALIRVSYTEGDGSYKEMGQRITGSDGEEGLTYFYMPVNKETVIRITKDGYSAEQIQKIVETEEYPKSSPLTIKLSLDEITVYKSIIVNCKQFYNLSSTSMNLTVYAPSRSTVQFKTSYNPIYQDITLDESKFGSKVLQNGTDYLITPNQNFNITLLIDGYEYRYCTSYYRQVDSSKFNKPTGIDDSFLIKIVWVAVLLLSGVLGFLFKQDDDVEGGGRIGKASFFIISAIACIAFYPALNYLMLIITIYILGLTLRRWISE